jgi:hypothetical protein
MDVLFRYWIPLMVKDISFILKNLLLVISHLNFVWELCRVKYGR